LALVQRASQRGQPQEAPELQPLKKPFPVQTSLPTQRRSSEMRLGSDRYFDPDAPSDFLQKIENKLGTNGSATT
jgi:hypothetical protein